MQFSAMGGISPWKEIVMSADKTDLFVYAHWIGMFEPVRIGILSSHQRKGRKSFSFEYDERWVKGRNLYLPDPDIGFFSGPPVLMDPKPTTSGPPLF